MTGRRHACRGAALLSVVFSLAILVAAITVTLQTYVVGARSQRLTAQRNGATAALEAQLETLRAGGFHKLAAAGVVAIPRGALAGLPGARGELAVAPGPLPGTRTVTARVTWDEHGPRKEELTIVMARQGMNP